MMTEDEYIASMNRLLDGAKSPLEYHTLIELLKIHNEILNDEGFQTLLKETKKCENS